MRRVATSKPWTPQDVAQLEKLKHTHTAAQIGEIMGRTKNSIIGKLHQRPPKTKEDNRVRPEKIRAGLKRSETLVRVVEIPQVAPDGFKALVDAMHRECRYPSEESSHFICGARTERGKVYCDKHQALTHTPTSKYRIGGIEFSDKNVIRYKT